jgi:5-methyltetrahydropteroyltriglutamate--homocysteine methyltransferase
MTIQQNADAIRTTHAGSLPRPTDVLDQMKARLAGLPYDAAAYDQRMREAVAETVTRQVSLGIDFVSDGEVPKPGFFTYVRERLDGFEHRPQVKLKLWTKEVNAFPEYYEQYFKQAMLGGSVAPVIPLVCVGPIRYRGEAAIRRDIDNLKAAVAASKPYGAFIPATAPSGVGINEYYKTEEEYFHALGAALRVEYLAIAESGFLLQIDDPFIPDIFVEPDLDAAAMRRRANIYVESVNEALKGIPPEKVRFHTCYGINQGPRVFEAGFADIIEYVLRINAGAYSFEAANPRHEHEYHIWEKVKLPAGKVLIPGVITHCSNIVEHPELIAERLIRFAKLVGRENVIAGADCGFSSQATYHPEVHPKVVWAKFEAMREGARIATRKLWDRN